jgi:LemA protein
MNSFFIVLGVFLLIILWVAMLYNNLVKARNTCTESWSNIDTELKRRYELIPNLVETVKAYAAHEQRVLNAVVEARTQAIASTGSPVSQAKDENILVSALRQLFAVSENYPNLKASDNFLKLQQELSNTEDRIQAARRFYNANVRDFNTMVESVPSNLIAGLFSFQKKEFFEIENVAMRSAPEVKLQ